MAGDATGKNWTVETVVAQFVARRESPAIDLRVNGKWGFEKVVVTPNNGPTAIGSRADYPFEFLRFAKNLFAVDSGLVLALVEIPVACIDLEMAIKLGVEDAG